MRTKSRQRPKLLQRLNSIGPGRAAWLACVILVSLAVAASAAVSSLANAARKRNPQLAVRVADDPVASLSVLQSGLRTSPRRIATPEVPEAARAALRRQPTSTMALGLLAAHADANRNPEAAASFAALSERMSRRDLFTQIFLIEQAVRANDYELALRHYDKALRTNNEAKSILFPVLSVAISDDVIRRALAAYVRKQAAWMPYFVQYAMWSSEKGPSTTAQLLAGTGRIEQSDLMKSNATTLLGLLVDRQEFELAQQLFLQMPGSTPDLLQSVGFTTETTANNFAPISWDVIDGASAGVSFEGAAGAATRSVRVFANSGEKGVLLRRLIQLEPGAYRHSEIRTALSGDATSRAIWEMKCASGGGLKTIWRGPSQRVAYRLDRGSGPTIPNECASQLLELAFYGGDDAQGMEFVIENFNLVR